MKLISSHSTVIIQLILSPIYPISTITLFHFPYATLFYARPFVTQPIPLTLAPPETHNVEYQGLGLEVNKKV